MQSNYRLITVNGIKYAWGVSKGIDDYTIERSTNFNYLRIWKKETKEFLYEVQFPMHKTLTLKLVANVIKADDAIARNIVVAEPCPFCQGKISEHPNPEWREFYYVCYHEEDCYLCEGLKPMNFNLINVRKINQWNLRYDSFN
jgi:hypothetical protein